MLVRLTLEQPRMLMYLEWVNVYIHRAARQAGVLVSHIVGLDVVLRPVVEALYIRHEGEETAGLASVS